MTRSVVAVVTLAHGRHAHLRAQLAALAAGTRLPDIWVGAAMDDELLESVVRHQASSSRPAEKIEVVHLPRRHGHLPLAAARNLAAAHALADGADLLVLLDVDCIPSPRHVQRYAEVWGPRWRRRPRVPRVVLCGAVHYLPARRTGQDRLPPQRIWLPLAAPSGPTPSRPTGSTSLGSTTSGSSGRCRWPGRPLGAGRRVRRGLRRLRRRGHRLRDAPGGSGGVAAGWGEPPYHQHHAVEAPPRRHLADIVRNSNRSPNGGGSSPCKAGSRLRGGGADHAGRSAPEVAPDVSRR